MMIRRTLLVSLLWSASLAAQTDSVKGVRIGLTTYGVGRPGIAVLPVPGMNGDSVRAMLQRDLDYGDRVEIKGMNADDLPLVDGVPNFDVWARMSVAGIVQASITQSGELHVAVYDVNDKRLMQAKNFPLAGPPLSADWRMAVHGASDAMEQWLTGVAGTSATRIAFVRERRIWLVDSDGANAAPLGNEIGGSPSWHPSGRYLAYSTLPDLGSGILMRDLVAGGTRRLTQSVRSGAYMSPAFSPDGTTLAYAFGEDGTNIFVMDPFQGGHARPVTLGRSANTSPTFSPDGRQIAFTSGRMRTPEVYIADVDGSNVELLTQGGFSDESYRSSPSWSPDGRSIAYQSQIDGRFQVMVISPATKSGNPVTSDSQNEDPYWGPDSRHIVFTSERSGNAQLWVLDTESGRLRQLTRGASAKNGAWSPPLVRR